jgi:hypothetical protein
MAIQKRDLKAGGRRVNMFEPAASLPDGSQVLRGKIFFVTFLYRLCVTRRIVSRGWKSLPVNFPFRREDNRAGHTGDGML